MGFRFPLATVLRLKQSIEKQEELAFQKILLEMSKVQHRIEVLTSEIAHARQVLDRAMQQVLPAVDVDYMTNQIGSAMDRKQELIHSLAELRRQREMQYRRYQAAHNSRQMLSDMQTRQQEAYAQERARAEQKFLDEISTHRAQRS